jgi:hypothetical protein
MRDALVGGLAAASYTDVDVTGNTVRFRFGTPHTYQPRSATPELVATADAANAAIVTAYDSLGLPNNDPNTVGGLADALVANSITIYSQNFAIQTVSNLIQSAGVGASTPVLLELYQRFSGLL